MRRTSASTGAAANPLGHGHNYVVEVAIEGEPDPVTGMILDLKRLKEILEEKVLEVYDHRLLNREVESVRSRGADGREYRDRYLEPGCAEHHSSTRDERSFIRCACMRRSELSVEYRGEA